MSDQITMKSIEDEVTMAFEVSKSDDRFKEILSMPEKAIDRLILLCYYEGIIDEHTAFSKIQKAALIIVLEESWDSARKVIERERPRGLRIFTIKK